jgi:hypothetical protein
MPWRTLSGLTLLAICCLIPLVGRTPDAKAGPYGHSCGHGQQVFVPSYSSYSYSAPVVTTQYVAPVAAHHAHREVVIVPKAVKVLVSPDFFYSVSDGYRDAILADAIAYRVLAASGRAAPVTEPYLPRYAEPGEKRVAPRLGPPPAPDKGGVTTDVNPALAKLVDAKCAKCHSGGSNGIDLDDLGKVSEAARWKSYALVNKGRMPKGGKAIADDEVDLFFQWAESARKSK